MKSLLKSMHNFTLENTTEIYCWKHYWIFVLKYVVVTRSSIVDIILLYTHRSNFDTNRLILTRKRTRFLYLLGIVRLVSMWRIHSARHLNKVIFSRMFLEESSSFRWDADEKVIRSRWKLDPKFTLLIKGKKDSTFLN